MIKFFHQESSLGPGSCLRVSCREQSIALAADAGSMAGAASTCTADKKATGSACGHGRMGLQELMCWSSSCLEELLHQPVLTAAG